MGYVREPKNVDFVIQSRPLTKDEEIKISEYIKSQKNKKRVKYPVKKTIKSK